jgi:predicted GNAT family acetyltransferase
MVGDSKSRADAKLDEALEETFPASDPAANTVETGIRTGEIPSSPSSPGSSITDNHTLNRFELSSNGQTAFLLYERTAHALTLIHTEVPPALRGRHLGEALVNAALQSARSTGVAVIAVCPFARAYLQRHPPSQQP